MADRTPDPLDSAALFAGPPPSAGSGPPASGDLTPTLDPDGPGTPRPSGGPRRSAPPRGAPQLPGYDILGKLGEGGMGVVWRAVQRSTQRQIALKTTTALAGSSRTATLRFEREVELAARLEHPHIARVYDSGQHEGIQYYAMQLVDGLPLDEYVAQYQPDRRALLRLMQKIARAVQHAHQKGMIHRDLKPSNILVRTPSAVDASATDAGAASGNSASGKSVSRTSSFVLTDPEPVLLDFGLAKPLDHLAAADGDLAPQRTQMTQPGQIAGTLAYMAPEQAAGRVDQLDTRTDLYALGVILYQLLTGLLPHDVTGPASAGPAAHRRA